MSRRRLQVLMGATVLSLVAMALVGLNIASTVAGAKDKECKPPECLRANLATEVVKDDKGEVVGTFEARVSRFEWQGTAHFWAFLCLRQSKAGGPVPRYRLKYTYAEGADQKAGADPGFSPAYGPTPKGKWCTDPYLRRETKPIKHVEIESWANGQSKRLLSKPYPNLRLGKAPDPEPSSPPPGGNPGDDPGEDPGTGKDPGTQEPVKVDGCVKVQEFRLAAPGNARDKSPTSTVTEGKFLGQCDDGNFKVTGTVNDTLGDDRYAKVAIYKDQGLKEQLRPVDSGTNRDLYEKKALKFHASEKFSFVLPPNSAVPLFVCVRAEGNGESTHACEQIPDLGQGTTPGGENPQSGDKLAGCTTTEQPFSKEAQDSKGKAVSAIRDVRVGRQCQDNTLHVEGTLADLDGDGKAARVGHRLKEGGLSDTDLENAKDKSERKSVDGGPGKSAPFSYRLDPAKTHQVCVWSANDWDSTKKFCQDIPALTDAESAGSPGGGCTTKEEWTLGDEKAPAMARAATWRACKDGKVHVTGTVHDQKDDGHAAHIGWRRTQGSVLPSGEPPSEGRQNADGKGKSKEFSYTFGVKDKIQLCTWEQETGGVLRHYGKSVCRDL